MGSIEFRYYQHCLKLGRPYFGKVMQAFQGSPIRHGYMHALMERECSHRWKEPFLVMEIGSWAGGSAISWAEAIKTFNHGKGLVVCIDPWKRYFDSSECSDAAAERQHVYREMTDALSTGEIFDLFLHNIRASSHEDRVLPFRGLSDDLLPLFGDARFDLIFIDGDHTYGSVLRDITNSARLLREGGVLCGDDLELQVPQIDLEHARIHKDRDYVRDPKTASFYHPGVALAVYEFFKDVSTYEGFWVMRKRGGGWEKVDLPALDSKKIVFPEHLQGLPRQIEQNYRGFNILKYWDDYYALAQALGPMDLTQLEEEALSEYQGKGMCFIGKTLLETKRLVDESDVAGAPELVEEDYKGFNIVRYGNKHYALVQTLGNVDLAKLDTHTLEVYQAGGKGVVGNSLEETKGIIDQLGFQGSPKLVEEGYHGFNIVLFEYTHYALSLTLGPVDLAHLEEARLREYQEAFKCFVGPTLEAVKWVLDRLLDTRFLREEMKPFSQGIPGSPSIAQTGSVSNTGTIFSREGCLRYDGKREDRQCLTALIHTLLEADSVAALYGTGKLCTYILNILPQVKRRIACIIDDTNNRKGRTFDRVPIVAPEAIPAELDAVFLCETRWRLLQKMEKRLPKTIRIVTLDTLVHIAPEAIPSRAWVPEVKSIYPVNIPDFEFLKNQDMILLDFPARSIAQMPAGFAFVHNALKKTSLTFQTVDLDNIIYHRFHSHRVLDGVPQVKTDKGTLLPEDPWQPVHYLEWEKPEFIEFFHEDIEEIAAGLIEARPKMIGISLQQANIRFAREVVKKVREGIPNVIVVVGGMSCLQPSAAKMVFPEADYTVVGEADLVIGPLAEALARGEKPHDLPGVWSGHDSPDRNFTPGPLVQDLDSLDHPRYEWTDIQLYRNWNGYQLTPIVGSRGCHWSKCTFCAERFSWRTRSPERVAEEMEWLYRQGFNTFVFNESDLHGDPKLIERLCDEIIQRRMKVNMTCQLRCHPKVDKAYFQKMREAGFVCLRFGIDGGSTNALRLQRKGYPKEVVRRNLKDAAEAGIYTEVNLVIGVPGETEEDIDETIDFFGELKNTIGRLAYINPLMLFRGSEYWEHPERFGIVFRSDKEELYRTYPVAVPDHEWYSTDPYIDRDIRYTRLKRVVIALRKMGVPLGEFADYTAERIGEAGKDLANTHNAKNDLTREACPSKQKERQAPGPLEISKSQTTTTHPHTPCEIKLKGSEKILLIGTGTQQSVRSTLERLEYYNDITLLIPQGNAHHWPGYQTFEFSNNGRFIPQLREQHFDMVIVLYDHRLGKMAFEKFASQFVNQLLAVFSNGQMRLYPNDHLSRVVYNMAYLRSLFNYVPNLRGKRILEVGCSDGLVCDLMTHEDPEEIIGIDLLETVGCNYPGPKITYARMDASNLDFADQSFDLCYSIATLEHCKDPFKVLQEMKRVTKKGGTCYVQAGPLYYSPFGHHMFGYFDDIPWIHLRSSKEEILAYASKRGIDQKVKTTVGVHLSDYLDGMLNKEHINEKSFAEYRLPEFMASPHIDVLNFSRSYEGKEFLNEQVLTELSRISPDDLVTHGFELVFGVKG